MIPWSLEKSSMDLKQLFLYAPLGKFEFLMTVTTEKRPGAAVAESPPYGNTSRDGINVSF